MRSATRPCRIVVFAKAPLPGQAKTRLIPALGAPGAAALARRMLDHTLATALAADLGPVELSASPGPGDPSWTGVSLPAQIAWSDQGSGDLGTRMARAALRTLLGGEPALLIGTDCPEIAPGLLQAAAASLLEKDACIVPAADGGYVLFGLRRFHASVFEDIPWSSDAVLSETRERLARLGWSVEIFPLLHDIDTPQDLTRLPVDWTEFTGEEAACRS
jgi:rSAM/selenodomain-associated transferase 1